MTVLPERVALFVTLGRPKFLFQSMLVTGAGVAVAVHTGVRFGAGAYALTLGFAWCTHLMTHYCNEYFDLEADRANRTPTSWTGGSRILVRGLLPPVAGLGAAFVLLFTALVLIAVMPGTADRLVAVAITALAWFYTAPPLRLNYHALGELTCATVLYALGPVLAHRLQGGGMPPALWACVGVLFALQVLRCLIMNLSDIAGDQEVGKRTGAGALGRRGVAHVYGVGQVGVHLAIAAMTAAHVLPAAVGIALFVLLPVPGWVGRQLYGAAPKDQRRADAVAFWASMHMPLTSCALMAGLTADGLLHHRPASTGWLAVQTVTIAVFTIWLWRTARVPKHDRPHTVPDTAAQDTATP
ncbi:prenyltransferase [Streptomyces minutiscleroticus]|uniref:prenyltransferase n=1 Tax=Streptomyces minutiscleroticus TaxID=68238 RepID=UPI000A80C3C5